MVCHYLHFLMEMCLIRRRLGLVGHPADLSSPVPSIRSFSDLGPPSLHQGRPRLEVSLLLTHLMDLIDAMRLGVDAKRLASIARRVSTLNYEGGAREAVLGRVVKACLR